MKITSCSRLVVSLLLSLSLLLLPSTPSVAADARWSEIPLPRTGVAGGWALAPGTDITQMAADNQGRLFAWAAGEGGGLFRAASADDRFTRLYASGDSPVAINITENQIYYATEAAVY